MVGPGPAFYPGLSNQIVMIVGPSSPPTSWVAATRNPTNKSLEMEAPLVTRPAWNLGTLRHTQCQCRKSYDFLDT